MGSKFLAPLITHTRVRASMLVAAFATAACVLGVPSAYADTYSENHIVSDQNIRASYSMSSAEIQSFLNARTGMLKSLTTTDHAGVKMKASTIIYKAAQNFRISPRVILAMLQKEQSLLTRTSLTSSTLTRALGAGCPDSKTNYYPGFGKQVWYASWLLRNYGEIKAYPTTYVNLWTPGMTYGTYTTPVVPENLGTYKLYVYNPSLSGNKNFWTIYNTYFGSPLAVFVPSKVSLTATSAAYTTIKLDWPNVSGATAYSIYRAVSSDGPYSRIATTGPSVYSDTNRTTGVRFYYKVRASHTESSTVYGATSSVQSARAVPEKVSLSAASAGYRTIKLNWPAVEGTTYYQIFRATSAGGSYTRVTSIKGTIYANTGRTTGKPYYYKVRSYHLQGTTKVYGSFSAIKSAVPVPAKVVGLSLTKTSSTSIRTAWSAVTGATGYTLYRATSSGGNYVSAKTTSSTTITNTGLTTDKTYWYKVRAYHLQGTTKVYGQYSTARSLGL